MDQNYRNLYLQERQKLIQISQNLRQEPILIDEPNKLFSQNTTIQRRSDNTEFSGHSFPEQNPAYELQKRSKQLELEIICEAIQRDHDDSIEELAIHNQFQLDCLDQDIKTQFNLKVQKEQHQLLA